MKKFLFICANILIFSQACQTSSSQETRLSAAEYAQFQESWASLTTNCYGKGNLVLSGSVFWNRGSSAFEAVFEKESDTDLFRLAFLTPFGNTVSEILLQSGSTRFECSGKCPEQDLEVFNNVTARDMRALVCGGPALLFEDETSSSKTEAIPVPASSNLDLEQMPTEQGNMQAALFQSRAYFAGHNTKSTAHFSQGFFDRTKEFQSLSILSKVTFGWILTTEMSIEWRGCKRKGKIFPSSVAIFTKAQKIEFFLNEFEQTQTQPSYSSSSSGQNCNIAE